MSSVRHSRATQLVMSRSNRRCAALRRSEARARTLLFSRLELPIRRQSDGSRAWPLSEFLTAGHKRFDINGMNPRSVPARIA